MRATEVNIIGQTKEQNQASKRKLFSAARKIVESCYAVGRAKGAYYATSGGLSDSAHWYFDRQAGTCRLFPSLRQATLGVNWEDLPLVQVRFGAPMPT